MDDQLQRLNRLPLRDDLRGQHPYGAPQMNTVSGQMSKCDFCIDLLAKGEDPVCVATCPLNAIKYGDIEALRAKYGSVAEARGLPPSARTKPNLVIKAHQGA